MQKKLMKKLLIILVLFLFWCNVGLTQDKILGGKKTDLLFKCSSDGNSYWGFNEVDFGSKKKWVIFPEGLDNNADEVYAFVDDILTPSENGHMLYWYWQLKDEKDAFYWFKAFRLELNNPDFKSSENNKFTMVDLALGDTFAEDDKILINDKIYYASKELESSRIHFKSPSITKEKIEIFKKNLETHSNELRNFEKDWFEGKVWEDYDKLWKAIQNGEDAEITTLILENSVKDFGQWKCEKIQY